MRLSGDPLLPVRRARLEVDRTLRTRDFIGRAVRGSLDHAEYFHLVAQLGALAYTLSADALDLVEAANQDARELQPCERGPAPTPCATVCFAAQLFQAEPPPLEPSTARALTLALLGTSWCRDAADQLEARFGGATRTLDLLASLGPRALRELELRSRDWADLVQEVYAFTELARGAMLGLVTHLESLWPTTIVVAHIRGGLT